MVLLRESARASAARKAFRAGKNRALPTIPLCRPKRPPIQPLRFRWISSPLCRCLFLRAFLSLWLKHQVFPLLLASLRLPSKRSPAGPFCIALSCPAGMPAASHRACAALVEPFLRPSQNRSECKFRRYEPYFESATQCTSSQDSPSSASAAEYLRSPNGFYVGKGFRRMMKTRFGRTMARHQNTARSLFATLCLIAVVLLYAPLGGAAWFVYSGACCNSGSQCPIHGHHSSQTPSGPEHAMDCSHGMLAMRQCSMSCCHDPDRPAIAPVIFVLPAHITVSASTSFALLVPLPGSKDSVNSIEPLSPPPRTSAPAA